MIKKINVLDHPLWEKARKKRTLLNLTFELTTRCNNNCIHCFNNLSLNDKYALKNELSTNQIKAIVDQGVELGVLWITLTGGEILLRNDFIEIYTYIQKKGCLVSIFTNATLIKSEHIRLFQKHPPRNIEISAYGACGKSYAKVTRTRNFSKFISGIEKLSAASIPFTLKTIMMKANVRYFNEIAEFCKKRTKKKFRFDPFLILRTDRNQARNKDIINQRLSADEIIKLEQLDSDRFKELHDQCVKIDNNPDEFIPPEQLFKCGAGLNGAFINSFGIFQLCHSLVNNKCVYDLKNGSLKEAWQTFVPKILSLKSKKESYKQNCGCCKMISLCMWCPATSDLETNKFDQQIESFCTLTKKRHAYCKVLFTQKYFTIN